MKPFLSVVLMCCNEHQNLVALLPALESALLSIDDAVEINIVDDGSTDGTLEWLAQREHKVPLQTISHGVCRGYGAAVRTGLSASSGDRVLWMDGDGQFDPEQISGFVNQMEAGHWDMVIGERVERADSYIRRSIGDVFNLFAQQALGQQFRDIDCGFKLIRRAVIDSISLKADGNLISAELLTKAKRKGFRVKQLPVRHLPRQHGHEKGVSMRVVFSTAKELVTLWRDIR